MRALLDTNVLIALFDEDHTFHERAHAWWEGNAEQGWASCPFTENGCTRIMSNAGYSRRMQFSPTEVISKLAAFVENSDHQFWSDDLSLRDGSVFVADRIHRSKEITDLYLLALAVRREGRLATFDESITTSALKNVRTEHLCAI